MHYCICSGFLCVNLTHKCEGSFVLFVSGNTHANVLVISISFRIYVGCHVQ